MVMYRCKECNAVEASTKAEVFCWKCKKPMKPLKQGQLSRGE